MNFRHTGDLKEAVGIQGIDGIGISIASKESKENSLELLRQSKLSLEKKPS